MAETEASALQDCNRTMGKDCTIAITLTNGFAVLIQQQNGIHWISNGPDTKTAVQSGIERCQAKGNICATVVAFQVDDGQPDAHRYVSTLSGGLRKKYAAIVGDAGIGPNARIWVAAGRESADFANQDGLANCRVSGGKQCRVLHNGGGLFLLAGTDDRGKLQIFGGPSLEKARALFAGHCAAQKYTACKELTTIDTQEEQTRAMWVRR